MLKQTLALVGLTLSLSANAVVFNTLNGIDYQWLELTETQGLSRDVVEARLTDENDVLYGYEYASRQLVEDLFFSYANYDGRIGWHGDTALVTGIKSLIADFGATAESESSGTSQTHDVDGNLISITNAYTLNYGLYGTEQDLCGLIVQTCQAYNLERGTAVYVERHNGWDDYDIPATAPRNFNNPNAGSYLIYAPAAVPVPAAGWLFMSALVGLVGKKRLARR